MARLPLSTLGPGPSLPPGAPPLERLFYDGHCALCHRAVRFVLARDPRGDRFRFAPLDGETFRAEVAPADRSGLPDSVAVLTSDGRLLTRSEAVLHILHRVGGPWRALAAVARLVPRSLRDRAYDAVARRRQRLFGRTAEVCPLLPAALRARFDR